jgi:hypothetical protein
LGEVGHGVCAAAFPTVRVSKAIAAIANFLRKSFFSYRDEIVMVPTGMAEPL